MKDFAFTGGRPDPYTFPTEGLIEASAKALRDLGGSLVNYPGETGYQGLRELASMRLNAVKAYRCRLITSQLHQAPCRRWSLCYRRSLNLGIPS